MKKRRGKVVQPPFAGIILIRYAGIISAILPFGGSTPVTKLIYGVKVSSPEFNFQKFVTFISLLRYKRKLL